ncbi:MAG TPA: hypothetical protein VN894_15935, partial [Polyangiaceae bacterium]|nr:hypothetical protein [Polyangiaceae bacterium]
LLATLESLAYLVRPTSALVLAGTAAYVALTRPRDIWQLGLTVAAWLGLFVLYSWSHFHKLLPDYYAAGRLQFAAPVSAFLGNLISPSRGLLVCVPAVLGIGLLMTRYRHAIRFRALTALALFVMVGHLIILSGFVHWWGGYSFGARLTASLVPWLVLLGVIAIDAARATAGQTRRRPVDVALAAVVAVLCVASIAINAVGAFSSEAQKWNAAPEDIDQSPERLWSWRCPQFLAPFVEPEGPFLPLPIAGLHVGRPEASRNLGRGWGFGEGEFRWTDGRRGSTVRFTLAKGGEPGVVELETSPYLAPPKVLEQRLLVSLNGRDIGSVSVRERGFARHAFIVPAGVAKQENLLTLRTPDAASPYSIEGAADRRQLGVAVRVIRWHRDPAFEWPFFLLPTGGLHAGSTEADKYLGRGWPVGEGEFRWTDGRDGSVVRFALATEGPGFLEVETRPYLAPPTIAEQQLIVSMNGREIGGLALREPGFATHIFAVPADVAQPENLLRLVTPDATRPSTLGATPDRRELGVAVRAIRWHAERDREGPFFPLPVDGLQVGAAEADKYLGSGWPPGEGELRWTEGADGSTVRFALEAPSPGALELEIRPYLAPPAVPQQRLIVSMNGHDIGSLVLREHGFATHAVAVPADVVQHENLLQLRAPDAVSPSTIGAAADRRQLGVGVRAIRWLP